MGTVTATHLEVRVTEVASGEGEEGTGGVAYKVVVGTRAEDDRATRRQALTTHPSVPPSECPP